MTPAIARGMNGLSRWRAQGGSPWTSNAVLRPLLWDAECPGGLVLPRRQEPPHTLANHVGLVGPRQAATAVCIFASGPEFDTWQCWVGVKDGLALPRESGK